MGDIMIRSSGYQAVQSRKQQAQYQSSRSIRCRLRDTRAAVAVQEGNAEADWQPWEDSMIAFEGQFQSMKEQFAHVDAFAGIYQER
jgi:hypothetical protein